MDYRMKYMVNEGCLLLAYAYAVSGYIPAALAFGFFSAFLAVFWHSGNSFLNNLPKIIAGTLIQIPFFSGSLIPGTGYALVLLAFCNTAVSTLWMKSSFKAIRPTIRILALSLPLFLMLSLFLPERVLIFLTGTSFPRLSSVVLDLLIFLPALIGYVLKTTDHERKFLGFGEIV